MLSISNHWIKWNKQKFPRTYYNVNAKITAPYGAPVARIFICIYHNISYHLLTKFENIMITPVIILWEIFWLLCQNNLYFFKLFNLYLKFIKNVFKIVFKIVSKIVTLFLTFYFHHHRFLASSMLAKMQKFWIEIKAPREVSLEYTRIQKWFNFP